MRAIGLPSGTLATATTWRWRETNGKRIEAFGPSGYRP